MAVKIGHASISENGTINGVKGDSTGREVCIRDYYNKNWDFVLRPKNAKVAEKSAKACEAGCANNCFGYSQNSRNTAHTEAKKVGYDLSKVRVKCNTDCSAYMTLCAISGGVSALEYTGNAPTTSTMGNAFVKSGAYYKLIAKKYLSSSDYLQRGDILVKSGSHTVMVLSNGAKVKSPLVNESKPVSKPDSKPVKNSVKAIQAALKKDSSISGAYKSTASLNVRFGAGTTYKVMVTIPKGTSVKNHGYYNECGGVKWLLIEFVYNGKEYTGYASSKYLKR